MSALVALALALTRPPAAGSGSCAYTAGPASVPVLGHPFAAEPSSDGCWLFVSLSETAGGRGGVAVLHNDGGRFVPVRTVPLAEGAAGLSLSHQGGRLLVASGDSILVLDVGRLESGDPKPEVGRIREPSGSQPIYVALSVDDRLAFVSDERAARLTVVDLTRAEREGFGPRALIGRIAQGTAPVGLALSPDGAWLYATSQRAGAAAGFAKRCRAEQQEDALLHPEGFLSIIDVAEAAVDPGHALRAAAPAGCNPVRVALAPDGRIAASGASRRRFAVGSSPVGVAVQPGSGRVWVSDSGRFSTADGEVQTVPGADAPAVRVPSGRFPRDLRFLPDGRTLVVAVFGSQAVQLVPTPYGAASGPQPQGRPTRRISPYARCRGHPPPRSARCRNSRCMPERPPWPTRLCPRSRSRRPVRATACTSKTTRARGSSSPLRLSSWTSSPSG